MHTSWFVINRTCHASDIRNFKQEEQAHSFSSINKVIKFSVCIDYKRVISCYKLVYKAKTNGQRWHTAYFTCRMTLTCKKGRQRGVINGVHLTAKVTNCWNSTAIDKSRTHYVFFIYSCCCWMSYQLHTASIESCFQRSRYKREENETTGKMMFDHFFPITYT